MSARRASTSLTRVPALPPLIEREPSAFAARDFGALEWQGTVRLAVDRAAGLSAARWQQHVRTGLLERVLVLGADHREGPHLDRPEAARRLLAHIDALAEAGLTLENLAEFAEEAEFDQPGALWALTILFGCLDVSSADDAIEAFIDSLDEALFLSYRGVREVAEALAVQPDPRLRQRALRWVSGSSAVRCALSLELRGPGEPLADDALDDLLRMEKPLVFAAVERLLTRSPAPASGRARAASRRPSWIDMPLPALAHEVARSRILGRDFEPLARVRDGDARAIAALGPFVIDVLALAGDNRDQGLSRDLAQGLPTTPELLSSMGRLGLPALFPRLLAELDRDDFDDAAHEALATAVGPLVERPSAQAWEQAIRALPSAANAGRLRGGAPHTPAAVIEEMRRPEHSAEDLRLRAEEVLVKTGRAIQVNWGAFGESLEGALYDLARLAR